MIRVKIIDKTPYGYLLMDNDNKKYDVNIKFYDLKNDLKSGDSMYLSERILTEKMNYYFGPMGSKYSKKTNLREEEFIKIVTDQEEFYVQRYYG